MTSDKTISIIAVDLNDSVHTQALISVLDHYANDPMGGGAPLCAQTREELIPRLREQPGYIAFLAYSEAQAIGLINCFLGFSTFAARPLLNIHDLAVHADHRGAGVGRALLAAAETAARTRGCCKVTLEVLSNNVRAIATYDRAGFEPYALDPAAGQAIFMHKKLAC